MILATSRRPRLPVLLLALALTAACGGNATDDPNTPMPDHGITRLEATDTTPGDGAEARPGMRVSVHYTGWLFDPSAPDNRGRQFDSSKDRNEPFEFRLGGGEVIPGWDEGVAGMKIGGTRVLVIPPAMGYGQSGAGGVIPPNATLVFEVQLLGVS